MSILVIFLVGLLTTCLCALLLLITLYELQKIGEDADMTNARRS